jgi:hypothetical protein
MDLQAAFPFSQKRGSEMKRETYPVTKAIAAAAMLTAIACLTVHAAKLHADERAASGQDVKAGGDASGASGTAPAAASKPVKPVPKLPEPKGARRLSPKYDVWIDPKNKTVIVDGQISLREGMLEMFACTRNTKEHESIVSANTKAFLVHTGLVTLGAEPGRPVQFVPTYRPPTGTEIEVTVEWLDERGKLKKARAQDWVKDINTKKAMTHPFVFAGSSFWTDEETGKEFYQAEGGDFICVSNFGTAMLDIPVESSPENSELAFEAFTNRIPPLGAPVRLILKPLVKRAGGREPVAGSKEQTAPADGDKASPGANKPKPEEGRAP